MTQLLTAQTQAPPRSEPNQPQATAPAAAGRPPIQTKSKEEFQAYQVAISNSLNPEAMEKAADDFAAKFPTSEVRALLYRAAMASYQSIGNSQKMMDMGLKVLSIDKDDPEALVGVAEVLEEHTAPTDLDRQQRGQQAIEYADRALKGVDTKLAVPAGTAPERVESYKKYLRATAYGIIGSIYYRQEDYAAAETNLRDSINADPEHPDAVTVLRLTLALDQQKKYSDALQQANRAVELTKEDADIGRMARNERDRLIAQVAANTPLVSPAASPAMPPGSAQPQNSVPTGATSQDSAPKH